MSARDLLTRVWQRAAEQRHTRLDIAMVYVAMLTLAAEKYRITGTAALTAADIVVLCLFAAVARFLSTRKLRNKTAATTSDIGAKES